jgi:cyclopropane fatty-acyl-phospholipid synthase-like methyltransferase
MEASDDALAHYDRVTDAWQFLLGEEFHYGLFLRDTDTLESATRNLTLLMASKGSIGPGMTVLDVGCGIGSPACFLAEQYRCQVTGISTSRVGIEHAMRLARERGCSRSTRFLQADAMDNGLPTGSFDRVWILESSHLMARKDALMAEAARVLRPGGQLALCDIISLRKLSLGEVLAHAKDFDHLHHAFGPAKMETLDGYVEMAKQAGLRPIETIDISDKTFPTLDHWRRNLEVNLDRIRPSLGDADLAHFRESCEILPRLWKEKILGYGLLVAVKDK